MQVYLVKQTQPSCDYDNQTIYVCSTLEKANEYAQRLNKKFGANCQFDEDWNFIDVDDSYYWDDVHFYSVESMKVDEDLIIFDEED